MHEAQTALSNPPTNIVRPCSYLILVSQRSSEVRSMQAHCKGELRHSAARIYNNLPVLEPCDVDPSETSRVKAGSDWNMSVAIAVAKIRQ